MGQCGCGDFQGDFKFEGPKGIIYVLQVYPSCNYCDTPAGVVLYAMDKEDCEMWDVEHIPETEIRDTGTLFSVIHPKQLVKTVVENIEAYIEDGVGDEFRMAVNVAIKDNKRLNIDGAKGSATS